MIERVMKVDPEAAVKLEDGKRPVSEIALRLGCCSNGSEQKKSEEKKSEEKKRESRWCSTKHSESNDGSAKPCGAQTRPDR